MNHYIRLAYKVPEHISVARAMNAIESYIYAQLGEFGCLPRDENVRTHIKSLYHGTRGRCTKLHLMIRLSDEEAVATAADRSEFKHAEKDEINASERQELRKISKRKRSDSEHEVQEKKIRQSICHICLDALEKKKNVTLECEHLFHYKCIKTWLGYKKTCPVCHHNVDLGL